MYLSCCILIFPDNYWSFCRLICLTSHNTVQANNVHQINWIKYSLIAFLDFCSKDRISRRKVHYCLVILKKKHILTCKAFPYTLSLDTIRAMWYDTKSILNVVANDKGIDSFHGHCLVKKISVGVLITLFFFSIYDMLKERRAGL